MRNFLAVLVVIASAFALVAVMLAGGQPGGPGGSANAQVAQAAAASPWKVCFWPWAGKPPKCRTFTPTPTPTPTPTATGFTCVTSAPSGSCGAYKTGATNSNGFNSYVINNCWADQKCGQVLSANSFSDWQAVSHECCDGSVRTAPSSQQVMTNWCVAERAWQTQVDCTDTGKPPVSQLTRLSSTYAESFPHNGQTIAQWAWDVWTDNFAHETMVWVDINNRCDSGAFGAAQAAPVTIAGQTWQLNRYPNSAEYIWVLGGDAACAQQSSGTVDLLALLKYMQAHGFLPANSVVDEVDGTFEICSTGGVPETFRVTGYTLAD